MSLITSPIGKFRLISILENLSWIYLIYCCYLKYAQGDVDAVSTPGRIHGALFCLYCLLLLIAMIDAKWSILRASLIFLTSLFPFVPFFIEPWLKREQQRVASNN
ncbi:MAG: DUF3817 domain-containing protein [Rubritalea sp.]|uniref:DUF3817 domain-containing protein n=1 Tax=Rubritalea sp. TaxID=2109375 RepID=UPI003242E2B0